MNKRCSQEWSDRSCAAWLARRIRIRLLPLLVALIVALAVFPVPAIAEGTIIRVGANADFGISVNGTSATGFAADTLREIRKSTGNTYQYVSAAAPELARKLAAGDLDIIPCVTKQELASWKELLAEHGYDGELYLSSFSMLTKFSAVYVRKGSSVAYSDLDSLRTKRIGYLMEDQCMLFPDGEFLTPELRQAKFVAYNTEEQMHSDFNSGKIDAVAKSCFRSWPDDIIVCQMSAAECYFMGTENSKDILDELDEAVGGIMMSDSSFSSNMYEKYVSRFGGQRYAYTESEKYYVTNNKKLTIGVNIQASMLDHAEGKTVTGALAETMNQLGEIAGMEIRLVPYDSIKNCVSAMKAGEVQAICGGVNLWRSSPVSGFPRHIPKRRSRRQERSGLPSTNAQGLQFRSPTRISVYTFPPCTRMRRRFDTVMKDSALTQ